MTVMNLTPHAVYVYDASQFEGLEQPNPTTWLADGVTGKPKAEYPSDGVARISTSTKPLNSSLPGEVVETAYGKASGLPLNLDGTEALIVSLPMQSMARQAGLKASEKMVAPYKVVRLRSNPSQVLGCMGFTY